MSNTVFAEGKGLFHKNSGGSGKAYPDVCLTPPPPPTGPVPVPYPNSLQASDLTGGSKKVKIQGAETALEDASSVSTSAGDEAGTQGGNVVTHKTKGKGFFLLWSFLVTVEGKGVARHGDPMGQNCGSAPYGCADFRAQVNEAVHQAYHPDTPCPDRYVAEDDRHGMVKAQRQKVAAGPCWQCSSTSPLGNDSSGQPLPFGPNDEFTPDHQPPVFVRWYAGGCHMTPEEWKRDFQDPNSVYPHCHKCSSGQGGRTNRFSQNLGDLHQHLRADAEAQALAFFAGI